MPQLRTRRSSWTSSRNCPVRIPIPSGAIALDRDGNIVIAGSTRSADLATPGAAQSTRASSNLYRIAQRQLVPVQSLTSAPLTAFTAHPQDAGTWLASDGGTLIRTMDAGRTWEHTGGGLAETTRISALAFAGPSLAYAAAGKRIYTSTDTGASWTPVSPDLGAGEANIWIGQIAVDPTVPETLFVATFQHAYRSVDGGRSWSELPVIVEKVTFDRLRRDTVYGIYRGQSVVSNDRGTTWKPITIPNSVEARAILPDPKVPGRLYVGDKLFTARVRRRRDELAQR